MPRGKRTTTDGFGEQVFSSLDGLAPEVLENEPKKVDFGGKVIIGTGVNPENVIRLDQEGRILVFEMKEAFLPLEDSVLGQLSRENRLRYSMAKEFHDAWRGDENAKLVEQFQVDRNLVGSATDKLTVKGTPGMHVRWARPDKIEEYRAKGYKILGADEAQSFLGPKGGHHEVGKLGQTELVAMGIPEELFEKRMKAATKKNNDLAGAWKSMGLNEMQRAGAQGFAATDDDKRRWTETDTEN